MVVIRKFKTLSSPFSALSLSVAVVFSEAALASGSAVFGLLLVASSPAPLLSSSVWVAGEGVSEGVSAVVSSSAVVAAGTAGLGGAAAAEADGMSARSSGFRSCAT